MSIGAIETTVCWNSWSIQRLISRCVCSL